VRSGFSFPDFFAIVPTMWVGGCEIRGFELDFSFFRGFVGHVLGKDGAS